MRQNPNKIKGVLLILCLLLSFGTRISAHPVSQVYVECTEDKDARDLQIERRLISREMRLWRTYDVATQRIYRDFDKEISRTLRWYGVMTTSATITLAATLKGCALAASPTCVLAAKATYAITIATLNTRLMMLVSDAEHKKDVRLHDANEDLQNGLTSAFESYSLELRDSSWQWESCIIKATNHGH